MTPWQEYLTAALAGGILLFLLIRASVRASRDRKWRAAERKLETVLQPKEMIKAVCPQKKGRVILTSKRLLLETREGFTAVNLKDIKRVRGNTKDKKTTSVVAKMVSLTVIAAEEHTIRNIGDGFDDLAKKLQDKIRQQNARKKKKT